MKSMYLELIDSRKEIDTLYDLVKMVWTQYYAPLMGEGKVQRFLAVKQSKETIQKEIAEGITSYYFIRDKENSDIIGYLSYHFTDKMLVIDRMYLLYSKRGQGLSNQLMTHLKDEAIVHGLSQLKVWINEENKTGIRIFNHYGFKESDKRRTPLDQGYVLNEIGYLLQM